MTDKKLTPKQLRFVDEYLIDLNATAAARRAGYSERTADRIGPELLGKTWISEAVKREQEKRSVRVEISQDYVIENLREIVERCMQRAPICDAKGEQVAENGANVWTFNARDANKALELLGKHLGLFEKNNRLDVSGGLSITVNYGDDDDGDD